MQLFVSDSGPGSELRQVTAEGSCHLTPSAPAMGQGTNFANKPAKSFASIIQNSEAQQIPGVKEGGGAH